jgi:uncharacterized protein DUF1206
MSLGRARQAPLNRLTREASHAAAEARPWVERLARMGFVAKGMVYLVVGVLAVQAAMGAGGKTTDTTGALRTLLYQPFGQVLLGVMAAGLFGYAFWRIVQAVLNPGGESADVKGMAKRIGHAANGLAYGALGFVALRIVIGSSSHPGGSRSSEDWTAWLMSQPFGRWLVALAGAVVIALGVSNLYRAWTAKFRSRLNLAEMDEAEEKWATTAGRVGYAARGIVISLVGSFLVQAALQARPGKASGLDGALTALARQPYGPWLLGLVAAGLIAYGVYMFIEARYRRIWT